MITGLPWWLSGKESTCNGGDMGLIPRMGRSPRKGNARGAWRATVHGVAKELDMTEQLNNNIMITRRKHIQVMLFKDSSCRKQLLGKFRSLILILEKQNF